MEKIELKLIKVSDRLYYLPHYEKNDWCTVALVIGDNHVMMLDSGASRRHVEMFMQQLEENSLPKPDLCFLTHWHWDHTYGLAHIDGVTSFATKATNEELRKMQAWGWTDEEMKKRINELTTKCNQLQAAVDNYEKRIAELEAHMPKEGEWIDEQRGRWIYAKCNLCGKVQDVRSNYCPNCGARMEE